MPDLIIKENHDAYPATAGKLERIARGLQDDAPATTKKWGDFICDIARKAKHYKLTEAQVKAVTKAMRSRSELDHVPDVGDRRVGISGEVLSLKSKPGYSGKPQLKMLLRTRMVDGRDVACKLYGTVPADLVDRVAEGAFVSFTASIDQSGDDPKFGFFGNPRDGEFEDDTGDRHDIENRDDADVTSTSGIIEAVRDGAGKCGHLAYNPNGEELICVADHMRSTDEPHEYLLYAEVKKLLESADTADAVDILVTEWTEEMGPRCPNCSPNRMAQPEHLFDAIGNAPWEYDPSVPDLTCACCTERIDANGAGPCKVEFMCSKCIHSKYTYKYGEG